MTDKPDLFSALDEAAVLLLKNAMGGGLDESNQDGNLAESIKDRVAVFSAVRAYAESRAKVAPPVSKEGGSKFDQIRASFAGNSQAPVRRSRAGKTQTDPAGPGFDA